MADFARTINGNSKVAHHFSEKYNMANEVSTIRCMKTVLIKHLKFEDIDKIKSLLPLRGRPSELEDEV